MRTDHPGLHSIGILLKKRTKQLSNHPSPRATSNSRPNLRKNKSSFANSYLMIGILVTNSNFTAQFASVTSLTFSQAAAVKTNFAYTVLRTSKNKRLKTPVSRRHAHTIAQQVMCLNLVMLTKTIKGSATQIPSTWASTLTTRPQEWQRNRSLARLGAYTGTISWARAKCPRRTRKKTSIHCLSW